VVEKGPGGRTDVTDGARRRTPSTAVPGPDADAVAASPGLVALAVRQRRFVLRQAIVDLAAHSADEAGDRAERAGLAEGAARAAVVLADAGDADGLGEIMRPDPDDAGVTWTVACYQIGDLTPSALRDFADPVEAVQTLSGCGEASHIAAELVASSAAGLRWTVMERAGAVLRLHLPDIETGSAGPSGRRRSAVEAAAGRTWAARLAAWNHESEPTTPIPATTATSHWAHPVDASWSVRPPLDTDAIPASGAVGAAAPEPGRRGWSTPGLAALAALAAGAGLPFDPAALTGPGGQVTAGDPTGRVTPPAAGAPSGGASDRPTAAAVDLRRSGDGIAPLGDQAVERLAATGTEMARTQRHLETATAALERSTDRLDAAATALAATEVKMRATAARLEELAAAHHREVERIESRLDATLTHHAAELEQAVTDHIADLEGARAAGGADVAGLASGLVRLASGVERLESRMRRIEATARAATADAAKARTPAFGFTFARRPAGPDGWRRQVVARHPWLRRLHHAVTVLLASDGPARPARPSATAPSPPRAPVPIDARSEPS
jgi:hypothetical protein